jgi:hypothetical protein
LDIDAESKYHQAAELQKLQEKLAAVGLCTKPYQSSNSGGWHLYLFLDNWEESSQVEQTLKSWLKWQGYSIECGQLEVFPSGNALRLPLQPGFGCPSSTRQSQAGSPAGVRIRAVYGY